MGDAGCGRLCIVVITELLGDVSQCDAGSSSSLCLIRSDTVINLLPVERDEVVHMYRTSAAMPDGM